MPWYKNLGEYIDKMILAIADERGVEGWFNDAFVKDKIDKCSKEEAWLVLGPIDKLDLICLAFKRLARKQQLQPQKRSRGRGFYAKMPLNVYIKLP